MMKLSPRTAVTGAARRISTSAVSPGSSLATPSGRSLPTTSLE